MTSYRLVAVLGKVADIPCELRTAAGESGGSECSNTFNSRLRLWRVVPNMRARCSCGTPSTTVTPCSSATPVEASELIQLCWEQFYASARLSRPESPRPERC